MPSRWLTIVIVVVWFATTGKLVVDDLLPRLLPDTPPSLAIELTEEPKMERPSVFWNVLQDGKRVMRQSAGETDRPGRVRTQCHLRPDSGEKILRSRLLIWQDVQQLPNQCGR
jgi:hypothetical protein